MFLCLSTFVGLASAQAAPLDADIRAARQQQLAEQAYWQTLLHYGPGSKGRASLIDDPRFFLSPAGKTDPQTELEMTLRGMYDTAALGDDHTLCRYPARVAWLSTELALQRAQLPQPDCAAYQQMIDKVAPTSTELIFPGPHINSPASMFGHTLLTIQGQYTSKLLTYAINYAAQTDETNGFLYAFKGIFGLYPGLYSFLPYYSKVREYSDMERRDIWEYRLNLTPVETRRLVDHVWELKDHYSDYFFFGENCSFNLLFLLEAARPGVTMTKESRHWVIPLETIRQIKSAGLIESATYRPSKAKRIEDILTRVSARGAQQAYRLSHTPAEDLKSALAELPEDPKDLLDLAIEDLDYQYLKQDIAKDDYKRRYVPLLSARSKAGVGADHKLHSLAPEAGHGSAGVSLFWGLNDKDPFVDLSFRPGYHNLTDPAKGYPPGAQIEYLKTELRLYQDQQPELQRFDLVNIFSVAPRNLFFPTTSWKIYAGARRESTRERGSALSYTINPGGGWAFGSPNLLWYLLAETRVGSNHDFFGELGASSGIIHLSPAGGSSTHLRAAWFSDLAAHYEKSTEIQLEQTIPLGRNLACHVDLSSRRKWRHSVNTARLGLSVYW